jgi:hypothetical protein
VPDILAAPRAAKTEAQIAQEEAYVAINKAMRNADCLATLGEVWKLKWADIKALSPEWQQELTAEKDRLKAELSQGAAA